jgi:hypothetical protein
MLSPHGVGQDAWKFATEAELVPEKAQGGLFFLIETNLPIVLTKQAVAGLGNSQDEMISGRNTLQRLFRSVDHA